MLKSELYDIRTYRNKKRAIIMNLVIIICEIAGIALSIYTGMLMSSDYGLGRLFSFYTEDSNIFSLIVCLILMIFQIRNLKHGTQIPKWAQLLKYMSTCCLSITFLVVLFILAPMMGGGLQGLAFCFLFGSPLFLHFLCPVLSFISLEFFEKDSQLSNKAPLLSLIPTAVYGAVLVTLNILRLVEGPYPFLMVYRQSAGMSVLWLLIIAAIALITGFLVYFIHKKLQTKKPSGDDSTYAGVQN